MVIAVLVSAELRSCVNVEVASLTSLSLITLMVSVDVEQHLNLCLHESVLWTLPTPTYVRVRVVLILFCGETGGGGRGRGGGGGWGVRGEGRELLVLSREIALIIKHEETRCTGKLKVAEWL